MFFSLFYLERCVAVTSPFLAKRFCTVNSARYSIYILLTVSIILFSTTFPIIYNININSERKKCSVRREFKLILRVYHPIVMFLVPDILLLSNLYTVYSLYQRHKQQSLNDENLNMHIRDIHANRKQRQLTIMLVTVNLTFYLFSTPAVIMFIAEIFPPNHSDLNRLKRFFLFSQISVLISQLHNATNFIFYCLAGQRFRQTTVETFYDYSVQLKIFYHRYILCNKEYRLQANYQLKHMHSGTITNRISSPESPRLQPSKRTLTF
ncbi:unnamed protein product [Rotaria sp. Silwood2]|nr:unnamed protein product [Rotaria sp. Silwood2]